ncbi:MAG: hypothetical protein M5U31_02415 [Acidimicrobiia bacterium]|nr:hypothetical protein [Acidimicrobiia bacterium]
MGRCRLRKRRQPRWIRPGHLQGSALYTYTGDSSPGDTNGQGVGGTWFVVGQDGINES